MANSSLLIVAGVTFATWAVYLGGLAALQSTCSNDGISALGDGFNSVMECYRLYGFYWFIMAFEFVLILGLGALAVSGNYNKFRFAFVGLFAVALYLFIEVCRVWVPIGYDSRFEEGQAVHRVRTIAAGAIMTAVMNGVAIVVAGIEEAYQPDSKKAETA